MKLEVAVAETAATSRALTIEIAAEEVKKKFDETWNSYTRYATVPGFRPGKVPRNVIKQRFAKDAREAVIGDLLPHALHHAIMDHKLRVVGEPRVSDLTVKEGEPLKFTVSVEIVPEFELKDYKALRTTRKIRKVTEEDINRTLERLRENAAQLVPVEDRASQDGDYVTVDLIGNYVDPQEKHEEEEIRAEGVEFEINAEGVQPEFNENLRGVSAGDVREFRVNYPEGFAAQGLAGKSVDFKATVISVKRRELPEINDEFAQEVSDKQTLAELREQILRDQEHHAGHQADQSVRDRVMDQLVEAHEFPVPDVMIEQQAAELSRRYLSTLMQLRVPVEEIKQINWEDRAKQDRDRAVRDVRGALVVGRIAEAENITVTKEEIEAEVGRMAASMRQSPEALKAALTKDDTLSSIENRLLYQKTLDFVVSNAEVTVEEFTDSQSDNQADGQQTAQASDEASQA